MAVKTRLRFEIFKRDGFKCQYCGRTPPSVVLHCDHVIPQSQGGSDDPVNLVTACQDCNLGKSDISLGQVPKPVAEIMAEAAERREQVEAYNQFLLEGRQKEDVEIQALGSSWYDRMVKPKSRGKWTFGSTREQSIRSFLKQLTYAEILEAIDIAHSRVAASLERDEKCWKYFCGICWTKIRRAKGEE